jgi:hypothetical protein
MAVERALRAEKASYTFQFSETVAIAKKYLAQGGIDLVLID